MKRLVVSTDVRLPPEQVYDFLLDFPRYADYSKHLRGVDQRGDGGPGTEYGLHFQWWKLNYTARSRVTEVDPPERIDWTVIRDIEADGRWEVERVEPPATDGGDGNEGGNRSGDEGEAETVSRVSLVVEYDPGSIDSGLFDLPPLVGTDWVVDRVVGLIKEEGERVVERIVADLEGAPRPVDLDVTYSSSASP